MQRIKQYTENFFKGKSKNKRYTMSMDDMLSFLVVMHGADVNEILYSGITICNYGYAKGYRACQAEGRKSEGGM